METPKLYMILLGCTPRGRNTEQHDIFFSIGKDLRSLVPEIISFWPEARGKIHIDAWREVNTVNGYSITVSEKDSLPNGTDDTKLFFINLGGYKKEEFDEFHYKMLAACKHKGEAIMAAKKTTFYRHTGIKGGESHVDDKYGVDVDDCYLIDDILSRDIKNKYALVITAGALSEPDELHLGYFKLDKL
ncbi:MAG: DUF1543 domain-containing protein [Ferruginibacter sp.]